MNPIVALIIANLIWGAAAPIYKYAFTNIPPFTYAFIRFFFAGLIFVPFIIHFPFHTITKRDWFEIIVGSLFTISINIAFLFLGLELAPSINASIVISASPVFLFILSIFFLHEIVQKRILFGMIISLVGVLLVVFSPIFLDHQNIFGGAVIGNIYYLISVLGNVIGTIILRNTLKRINPLVVTTIGFLFASLTFLPFMAHELQTWSFSQLELPGIIGIGYGVFLSAAAAYYLYYYGVSKILTQEVGIFMYVDPVMSVIVAIPLLHEYPTSYFFIGAVLVFGGIIISEGRLQYHPFHRIHDTKILDIKIKE